MNTPPFDHEEWNGIDFDEVDRTGESSTHIRFRMNRSRWEGTTFLHSKRSSDDNGDDTWTLRFAPDHTFKLTDGTRTLKISAREVYEDRANPLPEAGELFTVPPMFDADGWNEVFLPAEAFIADSYPNCAFRFTNSRWEGTTFNHPDTKAEQLTDGTWKLRFPASWDFVISDGRNKEPMTAREFFEDRCNPLPEPADPYVCTPHFFPAAWNSFEVPAVSVARNDSGESITVTLTHSEWEGLHFIHPASLCTWHESGSVSIRFAPEWNFKLLGGESVVPVSRQALWQDRTKPRAEPGESMAVEQAEWHSVVFHEAYLKEITNKWGTSWRIRFPWASKHPGAVVFHSAKLTREIKDRPDLIAFRFNEEWTFKLNDRDGGAQEMTAAEFIEATEAWAGRPPERTRGVARLEPATLEPAENVKVHSDLLAPIYHEAA